MIGRSRPIRKSRCFNLCRNPRHPVSGRCSLPSNRFCGGGNAGRERDSLGCAREIHGLASTMEEERFLAQNLEGMAAVSRFMLCKVSLTKL